MPDRAWLFFVPFKRKPMKGSDRKSLYLIALVPGPGLRDRVRSLKEEMRDRYGASHALKSPAHITLQMPFRMDGPEETALIKTLRTFASGQESFKIRLSGFDCFPPRVLYIKIDNPRLLFPLHSDLQEMLRQEPGFPGKESHFRFHPHMTLATRDLTEESFHKAWHEFSGRDFEAIFQVHSLFLLKHNGKTWDCFREFPFKVTDPEEGVGIPVP